MVSVKIAKGQSKDSSFRKFTKLVLEEGIVEEVRDRMFYKSPSLIKKEQSKELAKRRRSHHD
ncbi:MAG: 30S ribosomal protein S21 [Patescibacteria group bacterium]|jgi:ribosomal protein S21